MRGMKHRTNRIFQQKESLRDLVIIFIIVVIGIAIEVVWDVVSPLLEAIRTNESWYLTEVLLAFFILVFGFFIFHFRRYYSERRNSARYRNIYNMMKEGICFCNILYDGSGTVKDYQFFEMNRACGGMLGLERDRVLGRRASDLSGSLEPAYLKAFGKVASSAKPFFFSIL